MRAQFAVSGRRATAPQPRDQPLLAVVHLREDGGFAHCRVSVQHALDFPQLDAEAADLHLVVNAPQVFQIAIGEAAGEIAGLVEPWRVRLVGPVRPVGPVGQSHHRKPLRCQLRPVQIAPRQSVAADIHFPAHAEGLRLQRHRVQHMHLQVRDRFANDTSAREIIHAQRSVSDMHRRLSDAVHINKARLRVPVPREPRAQALHFQSLATEDHIPQRQWCRRALVGADELPERTRRLIQHRHALARKQRAELLRRTADLKRHHHHAPAVEQRAPDFPNAEIKGHAMEQRPHIVRPKAIPVLRSAHEPRHVVVRHHTALRFSRAAAGVDDIGRIVLLIHRRRIPVLTVHIVYAVE